MFFVDSDVGNMLWYQLQFPDVDYADILFHRLNEAVMHFGESIKEIINEEFGDGM